MKEIFTRLFLLALLTMVSGWASADNVTYLYRSWNKDTKTLTTETRFVSPFAGKNR